MKTTSRRMIVVVSLFVIVGLLIAACGDPLGGIKKLYLQASQYYTVTYRSETSLSASYQDWEEGYSNGMLTVKDQMALMDKCYGETADLLVKAANGVFDAGYDPKTGQSTGMMSGDAFIKALGTGTGFYAGNADRCQEATRDVMRQIQTWRDSSGGKRSLFVDQFRAYRNALDDEFGKAALQRLMKTYGQEMLQKVEDWITSQNCGDKPCQPIPLDFVGFPTSGLSAKTKSSEWCDIEIKKSHSDPMYMATWKGPQVGGYCLLQRQAAWDYMDNLFMAPEAATRVDLGVDCGITEHVDAETGKCVPNDVAPAPKK